MAHSSSLAPSPQPQRRSAPVRHAPQVQRVPSLLFFPKEKPRAPSVYSGKLDAEAIWVWVNSLRGERTSPSDEARRGGGPHAAEVEQRMAGLTSALAKAQQKATAHVEL